MTNINYLVFIWNVFVDTLLLLIVYAWKMYDMQTLHAGGIPMFRGTYLVLISLSMIFILCDRLSSFVKGEVESIFIELTITLDNTIIGEVNLTINTRPLWHVQEI